MILALLCYYKILVDLDTSDLTKNPVFWINTGYLFYFAGSLFLFILSNLLLQESERLNFISWGMHATLVAVNHTLIGIGLWQAPSSSLDLFVLIFGGALAMLILVTGVVTFTILYQKRIYRQTLLVKQMEVKHQQELIFPHLRGY